MESAFGNPVEQDDTFGEDVERGLNEVFSINGNPRERLLVTDGDPDQHYDIPSRYNQRQSRCKSIMTCMLCRSKSCQSKMACTSSIASVVTLTILIAAIICGVAFYAEEYPNIQKVISFVSQLEDINITEIKEDINTISESMDELQELTQALSLISNKTLFVKRIVYVVDYACKVIDCDKNDANMEKMLETIEMGVNTYANRVTDRAVDRASERFNDKAMDKLTEKIADRVANKVANKLGSPFNQPSNSME
jgi:hypothetical protein